MSDVSDRLGCYRAMNNARHVARVDLASPNERKGRPMLPMKAVRLRIGTLLAADATTLAPATDANTIALIKSEFTLEEDLVAADVDLADFDGSTPIAGATGAQQEGIDPATGDQIVTIKDPAGGYRFETTGVTNLPQTIYGYGLFNDDQTVLLGLALLDEPVTLTEANQVINLGKVDLNIVQQPIS